MYKLVVKLGLSLLVFLVHTNNLVISFCLLWDCMICFYGQLHGHEVNFCEVKLPHDVTVGTHQ